MTKFESKWKKHLLERSVLCCLFAEDSLSSLEKAEGENEDREWESKEDAEDNQAMSTRKSWHVNVNHL